jgi:hypothetical protein
MTFDAKHLHRLFTALYDDNEGSRNNAASAIQRYLAACNLHPTDIVLERKGEAHARRARLMARIDDELEVLKRENASLRASASEQARRDATRAGRFINRWPEFMAVVHERFGPIPPSNWRRLVAVMLKTSPRRLKSWERGLTAVPDAILATLATAEKPAAKTMVMAASEPNGQASASFYIESD